MLWQSRLRQRNLPGADHYHYDEYNLDVDEHNLNVDEHFDYDTHNLDFDKHNLDDAYVPPGWQLLHHQR